METAVNTSAITAGANIGTGDKTPNRAGTASSYRLTSRDVELAFKFFSSAAAATGATAAADGGRTVSKQDIHKKLDGLFSNLSQEEHRILFGTKAFLPISQRSKSAGAERAQSAGANMVSMESIERLLGIPEHHKGEIVESTKHFENSVDDVFELFDIDEKGNLTDHALKSIIQNFNNPNTDRAISASLSRNQPEGRLQLRFDKQVLLRRFDRDGDGAIGREDFVRIPEKQKIAPQSAGVSSAIGAALQAFKPKKK